MKRQYLMMSVSALLMCCLFVLPLSYVNAEVVDGAQAYVNQAFILDGASSASNSELMGYLLCTGMFCDGEYYAPYQWSEPATTSSHTWTTSSGRAGANVKAHFKLILRNNTNQDIRINSSYVSIKIDCNNNAGTYRLTDIINVDGTLIADRSNSSGAIYFANSADYAILSDIVVPANGDRICLFQLEYSADSTAVLTQGITSITVTWAGPSLPLSYTKVGSNNIVISHDTGWLKWIYDRVNKIYNILNHSQDDTGIEEMEGATEQSEQITQTETSYFTGTETALTGTGLSTYTYDTSVVTGLGGFLPRFTAFWGNLGPIVNLPILALSLKLATTILRHKPERRRTGADTPPPSRGRVLQGGSIEHREKNGDITGVIW